MRPAAMRAVLFCSAIPVLLRKMWINRTTLAIRGGVKAKLNILLIYDFWSGSDSAVSESIGQSPLLAGQRPSSRRAGVTQT